MKTFKQITEQEQLFESILNEAVFEKHIDRIIQQLKKFGNDKTYIKKFFTELGVNAADIDASRVKVYYDVDNTAKRAVKNALDEQDKLIVGLTNNKFGEQVVAAIWVPTVNSYGENNKGKTLLLPSEEGMLYGLFVYKNPLYNYTESSKAKRYIMFDNCNEIWIIDVSGMRSAVLKRERENARKGMWTNTPEFYASVVKKNMERYKKLITKAKIEKGSEFTELMKEIEEVNKQLMETFTLAHKNMQDDGWAMNPKLYEYVKNFNRYFQYALQYINDVLYQQQRFREELKHTEKNGLNPDISSDGTGLGYSLKEYRNKIEQVKKYLEQAKQYYKALMDGIKEFEAQKK